MTAQIDTEFKWQCPNCKRIIEDSNMASLEAQIICHKMVCEDNNGHKPLTKEQWY